MLQPQANQHGIFVGDVDGSGMNASQNLLSMSSPSARAPTGHAAFYRQSSAYGAELSTNSPVSGMTSSMTDRTARRGRSVPEVKSKVRPSPLMKPVQSPRAVPQQVWKRRDNSNPGASPSLGALESLSSTMQEASGLVMSSPALSPATNVKRSSSSQDRGTRRRERSNNSAPSTRQNSEGAQTPQAPLSNSPSPIYTNSEHPLINSPVMPATPGNIMGLVYNPTLPESKSDAQDSPLQSSDSLSAEAGNTHRDYANMSMYPPPSAVHAVATSAMMNAAQMRRGPLYSGNSAQHKPILPGGLSTEDRSAWMNWRRMGQQGGLDQRRTSHKAAEQKRRDSLKHCFDELRGLLPVITVDDNVPTGSMLGADGTKEDQIAEGFDPDALAKSASDDVGIARALGQLTPEQARDANRAVAKVLLLRHSNEYLLRLKRRIERRDAAVQALSEEVIRLRAAIAKEHGGDVALDAALGAPADRPATDAVSGELDSLHLSRESPRGDADAQPSEK